MLTAGIDSGSRTIKVAVYDCQSNEILACAVADQGINQEALAEALLTDVLTRANVERSRIARIVATGYGRHRITFAQQAITEITCHARGVRHFIPATRNIIDIGGQDSKFIRLDARGKMSDFAMNDRCAAGTGRFLELVAERLELTPTVLGQRASNSASPCMISSMCAVFAETEIIGLLASGGCVDDIAAGVQKAVAGRIVAMAGGHAEPPLILTGGVALIPGMSKALEEAFGTSIQIAPNPQLTGAIGAALIAAEHEIMPDDR